MPRLSTVNGSRRGNAIIVNRVRKHLPYNAINSPGILVLYDTSTSEFRPSLTGKNISGIFCGSLSFIGFQVVYISGPLHSLLLPPLPLLAIFGRTAGGQATRGRASAIRAEVWKSPSSISVELILQPLMVAFAAWVSISDSCGGCRMVLDWWHCAALPRSLTRSRTRQYCPE